MTRPTRPGGLNARTCWAVPAKVLVAHGRILGPLSPIHAYSSPGQGGTGRDPTALYHAVLTTHQLGRRRLDLAVNHGAGFNAGADPAGGTGGAGGAGRLAGAAGWLFSRKALLGAGAPLGVSSPAGVAGRAGRAGVGGEPLGARGDTAIHDGCT